MLEWLRGLTESDRRILRRIQRDHADLSDHVTLLSERLVRLDARNRKRASRALADLGDDRAGDEMGAAVLADSPVGLAHDSGRQEGAPEVTYSKEQLRDLGRERGFLPMRRLSQ